MLIMYEVDSRLILQTVDQADINSYYFDIGQKQSGYDNIANRIVKSLCSEIAILCFPHI